MSNLDSQDALAGSALSIALVALFAAVAQLIQTIISSARGLPSCDERVMKDWAKATHKRFRISQMRLEVQFEAPVIFLARRDNTKGPVMGESQIVYADGSPDNCRLMRTALPKHDATPGSSQGIIRERVHTVDNELASWVTLLEAIQKMEGDSVAWERASLRDFPVAQKHETPTLAVGVQTKTRSFDTNPAIKKPYATTTICHIIELAAVLGLHWKVFDRDENKYHAEGNGYSLLGTRISDFGIVFVFEKPGWPRFGKTRVIPTAEVKELCFGNVPTFFRSVDPVEDEAWKNPASFHEQASIKTLQLGSVKEIAETLHLIGVNEYTTQYYVDNKRQSHLFPVTFEIIGMLARTMHVRHRGFTYLPNPTIFPFNKQSFSLRRLLRAFAAQLAADIHVLERELDHRAMPQDLEEINSLAQNLNNELQDQDGGYAPPQLNLLHETLDKTDAILLRKTKDIVLDVLRRHIQEVLLAINTSADEAAGHAAPATPILQADISFDDLRSVPPENREKEFMMRYFSEIRYRVISTDAGEHHDPQAVDASRTIHNSHPHADLAPDASNHEPDEEYDLSQAQTQVPTSQASVGGPSTAGPSTTPPPVVTPGWGHAPGVMRRMSTMARRGPSRSTTWGTIKTKAFEVRRNTIWCTLVFRMICWLMLHDFNKMDVQLPSSELMGSRLPVYIM